jgi:hypothetical protein
LAPEKYNASTPAFDDLALKTQSMSSLSQAPISVNAPTFAIDDVVSRTLDQAITVHTTA